MFATCHCIPIQYLVTCSFIPLCFNRLYSLFMFRAICRALSFIGYLFCRALTRSVFLGILLVSLFCCPVFVIYVHSVMYYPLKKNKIRKLGILIVLISLRQHQSGHFNVFYDFNAGDRPFYYYGYLYL